MTTDEEIKTKLDKILFYFENDPKTGREGLVSTVARHEKELHTLDTEKKVRHAKASVWGIVGGTIISAVIHIAKWVTG